jgi:protein-tyrosine phosphatase
MIDLHTHVLPGVDDGPTETREAVEMCRLAAAGGCHTLVATPHQRHPSWWNDDAQRLAALLAELQASVGPTPRLLLGAEVRLAPALLDAVDRMPASGVLPLAGSRYLLIEAEREMTGTDPRDLVHELRLRGWQVVLAHPEFIPALYRRPEVLDELLEGGALIQITAGSLLGKFGRQPKRTACELMDAGRVQVVASDAHGVRWRPPDLGEARAMIAERWGEETARTLCLDNPALVIGAGEAHLGVAG